MSTSRSRPPRRLEKEGIDVEVVDLRSLRPLDEDTVLDERREDAPRGRRPRRLALRRRRRRDRRPRPAARVRRARRAGPARQTLDVPMPYNAKLEQLVIPQAAGIVDSGRSARSTAS